MITKWTDKDKQIAIGYLKRAINNDYNIRSKTKLTQEQINLLLECMRHSYEMIDENGAYNDGQ